MRIFQDLLTFNGRLSGIRRLHRFTQILIQIICVNLWMKKVFSGAAFHYAIAIRRTANRQTACQQSLP